ncbi:HAD-IA family hydrolase [Actinophytocola sp.]|uniref:HAD-IA family hydrolase n=1 Tax=Actinophytocola sp. TaxID=1872138 RepID=UPI0025C5BCB9|nr:HAD-IA family hydrolase [Actinophytocola sp.]
MTLQHLAGRGWLYPHDPDPDNVQGGVAVIAGREDSTVVDAGHSPALARNVQAAMVGAGLPPAGRLVYTHHHWDHTWGGCAWPDVEIIGDEAGHELLTEEARRPWSHRPLREQVEANPTWPPVTTGTSAATWSRPAAAGRNVAGMIRGVLLDFSGTLFHLEPGASWGEELSQLSDAQRDQLTRVVTTWSPNGTKDLPPDFADEWARRDLDPALHRRVYLTALARSGVELGPGMAEAAYARVLDPTAWQPYPDTVAALRRLRTAGIPVAVVSNIAWDIRDVFGRHGAADLVAEFVLSYVEGSMKPDPKIFLVACQRIGVAPEDALMVGDSAEADGGAEAVGVRTAIIDALPTADRPDALVSTLDRFGV